MHDPRLRHPLLAQIERRLLRLYGSKGHRLVNRLEMMIGRYGVDGGARRNTEQLWSERDAILITYADMVSDTDKTPLRALLRMLTDHVGDAFSTVHLLPFFPYSSDDGFSVIDYRQVDPAVGGWKDVEAFGGHYSLMFDLVLNHVSQQSAWFKNFVRGIAPYREFFVELEGDEDLGAVVRPRTSPLFHEFETILGTKRLWTTFSRDQVDLDFRNSDVLFEFLDILFLYLQKGARMVRLDAVAFLWKEVGTDCLHLPETHEVVRLLRDVVDLAAPGTVIITETNVPHAENVSYFGNGDEAHMVYQFTLPPLILHAFRRGDASALSEWAASLGDPPPGCTFMNFGSSHDGIGVRPLEGLVPDNEVAELAEHVERVGGLVSRRRKEDGTESPYELNCTYFDALSNPGETGSETAVARFLASQTIIMAFRGIPGIYFNSLLGSSNDQDGYRATGRARSLNRQKWRRATLDGMLSDNTRRESQVFNEMCRRLAVRGQQAAFHPNAEMFVWQVCRGVFGILRQSIDGRQKVACLHNVTATNQQVDPSTLVRFSEGNGLARDLLGSREVRLDRAFELAPYECLWLY